MSTYSSQQKPKIGIALGSGASRGLAHIGVIQALADMGIEADIVCGTSAGALVGAAYVAKRLDRLEDWACSLSKVEEAKFFDLNASFNGFVDVKRFRSLLHELLGDEGLCIEDLARPFATVATDLYTGREKWLVEGPLDKAVWASMALPGLFPAIKHGDVWLVDGGLVNPVPVSVCRALGAEIVIAVNLNGDLVGHSRSHEDKPEQNKDSDSGIAARVMDTVKEYGSGLFSAKKNDDDAPGLIDAISGSINITQDRITRSRLAGDPPDILLAPKLAHIGLLEIYRADEAIKEGEKCVKRMESEIKHALRIGK